MLFGMLLLNHSLTSTAVTDMAVRVRHGWVITSQCFTWICVLIHALIPMLVWAPAVPLCGASADFTTLEMAGGFLPITRDILNYVNWRITLFGNYRGTWKNALFDTQHYACWWPSTGVIYSTLFTGLALEGHYMLLGKWSTEVSNIHTTTSSLEKSINCVLEMQGSRWMLLPPSYRMDKLTVLLVHYPKFEEWFTGFSWVSVV